MFVIPIYFRSFEEHSKDYHKKFEKFKKKRKKMYGADFEKIYSDKSFLKKWEISKLEMEFQKYWYSWEYTQIIMYVEIYLEYNKIKAYLHSVDAKRFSAIMNKKVFHEEGKLADVADITSGSKNEEIIRDICNFIDELRSSYKRYYVDSTQIDNILPLIDFGKFKSLIFNNK